MADRYTMTVDSVLQHTGSVTASGYVSGTVKAGDPVWVVRPDGTFTADRIAGLENADGAAYSVSNEMASVRFETIGVKYLVPPLSVVTGIDPGVPGAEDARRENPYLLGLTVETATNHLRASKEKFPETFMQAVRSSTFLVPVILHGEWTEDRVPDFSFPLIGDGSLTAIPIFTDWKALENASRSMKPEMLAAVVPAAFDSLMAVRGKNHLVINPFGPVDVLLEDSTGI